MPGRQYQFFVYIAASRSHQLYVGFTNNLLLRMQQHREHREGTYTGRYHIDRLVYYEQHQYVRNAIGREKELKDWNRAKKLALIESQNPAWVDLAVEWEQRLAPHRNECKNKRPQIPSLRYGMTGCVADEKVPEASENKLLDVRPDPINHECAHSREHP